MIKYLFIIFLKYFFQISIYNIFNIFFKYNYLNLFIIKKYNYLDLFMIKLK